MWIIEVNFAGHRFTHAVHGHRRPVFRFNRWRPSQLRQPRAA